MSKYLSSHNVKALKRWEAKLPRYTPKDKIKRTKDAIKTLRFKKFLGYGVHRIAYDLGNGYVIKVATDPQGIRCNKHEYRIYSEAPPSVKKYLCPIVELGSIWIIMRKVKPLPPRKSYSKKTARMTKKFKIAGIIARDMKTKNLGLNSKKKVVVLDYGFFKLIPKPQLIIPSTDENTPETTLFELEAQRTLDQPPLPPPDCIEMNIIPLLPPPMESNTGDDK